MKRIISSLLSAIMLAVSLPITAYAESGGDKETIIEELFDKRDHLNVSIMLDQELGLDTLDLETEINNINAQLKELGVEQLTSEEVQERFGSCEDIIPYIEKPESNTVNWFLDTDIQAANGVASDVQPLTATAKTNVNSNLKGTKNITLQTKKNWTAGALKVLEVAANKLISFAISSNAGAKTAKTAYDYAKAYLSGISTTTEISDVEASYMVSYSTTVKFKFVKKRGQPESSQQMTFISTRCEVAVHGSFPVFTYKNGATHPNIISYNDRIVATPSGYNSNENAVKLFIDPSYTPAFAYVGYIDIYGLEGQKVTTLSPICPSYPTQVF